jgi:hypothetical protein
VSGEQANRNHRQNMIDATERMREAVYETMGIANTDMGRRSERQQNYGGRAKS